MAQQNQSLAERLNAIIEGQRQATEFFGSTEPVKGLPDDFGTLSQGLLRQIDMLSRSDPAITHPEMEDGSTGTAEKYLGTTIRKIGFISISHAVFECTIWNLLDENVPSSYETLDDDQISVLSSGIYLNREETAQKFNTTISKIDLINTRTATRLGVDNKFQSIRAALKLGYITDTLKPRDLKKLFDQTINTEVKIATDDMPATTPTTKPVIKVQNKPETYVPSARAEISNTKSLFRNLNDRDISIIDMLSTGMTDEAIANRLSLEEDYYSSIKSKAMRMVGARNTNNLVFLACRDEVLIRTTVTERRKKPSLTPEQTNIFGLLCMGLEIDEIASTLDITKEGVEHNLIGTLTSLGTESLPMAIRIAIELGVIK